MAGVRAGDRALLQELGDLLLAGLRRGFPAQRAARLHAEDFVQEALMQIHAKIDTFRFQSRFTTWAHTIATRIALAEMRRARWKDCSLETLEQRAEQTLVGAWADAPQEPLALRALRQAIADDLTPRQRTALYALLAEMPLDQIAQTLGLKRNALYKVLHEARKRLKQALVRRGIKQVNTEETLRA